MQNTCGVVPGPSVSFVETSQYQDIVVEFGNFSLQERALSFHEAHRAQR